MQLRSGRVAGLDVVRIAALTPVTVQHAVTVLGHEERSIFAGLSIGQAGIALFLAVSGFLAS